MRQQSLSLLATCGLVWWVGSTIGGLPAEATDLPTMLEVATPTTPDLDSNPLLPLLDSSRADVGSLAPDRLVSHGGTPTALLIDLQDLNLSNPAPHEPISSPFGSPLAQVPDSSQFSDPLDSAEIEELEDGLTPWIDVVAPPLRASPGTTFGTPTAFGASWRQGFVGSSGLVDLGGQGRSADGSIALGMGFGDPRQALGVELNVAVTSVSAGDFADSGSVGLKIHKVLPNNGIGLAMGWSTALDWGDAESAPETFYGVASKTFNLQMSRWTRSVPISISLGVGTGSFRSTGAIAAGDNEPNVFGSLGVRLLPQVSAASSWTGSGLNLGMGVVPFRQLPLTFSLGFTDVTGNTTNGTGFNFNAGYSLNF